MARVECRRGLVQQHDERAAEQADGDVDALHLAEREPLDGVVERVAERHRRGQLGHFGLGLRHAREPCEELEVLARAEPAVERRALRHDADLALIGSLDGARAGVGRAGQQREQRRLAGAVRAEQRKAIARRQREVDRAEHLPLAEALDQPRAGDQRGARAHAGRGRFGLDAHRHRDVEARAGEAARGPGLEDWMRRCRKSAISRPIASSGSERIAPMMPYSSAPATSAKITSSGCAPSAWPITRGTITWPSSWWTPR